MKKVLIAGGSGFIGSHLCARFLNKNYSVMCVDNLSTGNINNIKNFQNNSNFSFVQCDITQNLPTQITDYHPDYVLNFASPASPIDYQQIPIETLKVGSFGTLNLLELVKQNNSIFLQASTSEVYGDPLIHPQVETYFGNVNSFGPRSCYDESKRFSEALVYSYIHKFDLDLRVIRIFNTYGPNMRLNDGRVVPQFIPQALLNQPITIYGDGLQTRSFCYVSDLVDGIVKMIEKESGLKGEVVNLGNPEEHTILEFAKIIIELTNSTSQIKFLAKPKDDPTKRKPDISKAKRLLDWNPSTPLDVGLKKTIDYFSPLIRN